MAREKILIVDDEGDIVDLIAMYLRKEGYEWCVAGNGERAVRMAKYDNPDLIILDVFLPDFDGYEVCRRIRGFANTPILFLSCKDTDVDKVIGLSAGGDDYISKPFSGIELLARIRAHLRRNRHLQEQLRSLANPQKQWILSSSLRINMQSCEAYLHGRKIELSAKEFQMLVLFMRHPRQVLNTEQILREVWGFETELETSTVKVHIGNLRKKIEAVQGRPDLIVTVRGLGYRFDDDTTLA